MTNSKTLFAAVLAVAGAAIVTIPGFALAQGMGEGRGMMPSFETLDADGDGKVTKAEVQTFRANMVAGADANGDGLLNLEELTAQEAKMIQAMAADHASRRLEAQDADGDGQLSAEELLTPPMPRAAAVFDRLDADADGAVSQEEFAAIGEVMGRHGRQGHGMGQGMHDGGMHDGGMHGRMSPEE